MEVPSQAAPSRAARRSSAAIWSLRMYWTAPRKLASAKPSSPLL